MPNLKTHLDSFLEFLKSAPFSKAIILAMAIIGPVAISASYGKLNVGIAMAVGVLLSSPSDTPGSLRRRVIGIFASIAIAVFATLITGYAAANTFIFIPVLLVMTFSISLLSVYGFRASLISFSGLFAVVLGMANVSSGSSLLFHTFLIGCGGIGYLLLSVVLHHLSRKRYTEELLTEAFLQTSNYLRIRTDLLTASEEEREVLKKQLFTLQSEINDTHEIIRELVISRRLNSGKSGEEQKKLLIFIELVDILELGMANPVNYDRMDILFGPYKEKLEVLKDWSYLMVHRLEIIGERLKNNNTYKPDEKLEAGIPVLYEAISGFKDTDEVLLVYLNLVHFKEKQFRKIKSIERLLGNIKDFKKLQVKSTEARKFITHQEYNFKKLQDNFDLKSPIFRHSLRLTLVILIGYGIGKFFEVQNAYWILLTSLVIMRPGYALTKTRFKQRLIGTLIGGVIATSIIFLTHNPVVHGILAVITFILAFSMIQKNYKTAAIFITLNVVFIYSLLKPNAFQVIQFRLLDTVIGAGLAFLGNSFLWPTWEAKTINNFMATSVSANKEYLGEIGAFYQEKGNLPTSYKLARKQAFLASGNLSAAFQRATQEPKTNVDVGLIYQIVALNQELLTSIASLGTFIRTHQTTPASGHLKVYMTLIQTRLSNIGLVLEGKSGLETLDIEKRDASHLYFKSKMEELKDIKNNEHDEVLDITTETRSQIQEAQLIFDTVKWLLEISLDLEKRVLEYKA